MPVKVTIIGGGSSMFVPLLLRRKRVEVHLGQHPVRRLRVATDVAAVCGVATPLRPFALLVTAGAKRQTDDDQAENPRFPHIFLRCV